jgi:hypothetical protein
MRLYFKQYSYKRSQDILVDNRSTYCVLLQHLRIRPSDLYQFRNASGIMNLVGLLGRVISSTQGLYLHRTAQHRKTRTNIHALSGI